MHQKEEAEKNKESDYCKLKLAKANCSVDLFCRPRQAKPMGLRWTKTYTPISQPLATDLRVEVYLVASIMHPNQKQRMVTQLQRRRGRVTARRWAQARWQGSVGTRHWTNGRRRDAERTIAGALGRLGLDGAAWVSMVACDRWASEVTR